MKKFWQRLRIRLRIPLCSHVAETTMSAFEDEVCMKVVCNKCGALFFHEHFPAEQERRRPNTKEKLH